MKLNLLNLGRCDYKKSLHIQYDILEKRQKGELEDTFITLLKEEYSIDSGINPEFPGVWVGNSKIAAIGLAVKRGVTMHGFAFNVNTTLEHFKFIVPCGISGKSITSLEKLMGSTIKFDYANKLVLDYLCKTFNYDGFEELSL